MRGLSRRFHLRAGWRLLVWGLLCAPVAAAEDGSGGGEKAATFSYSETGYAILDPAHYTPGRDHDERLLVALLEPLTRIDPQTGEVKPAAAASWSVDATGQEWTFTLRPDAVWTDGKPVRAQDFIASWKRTLDPFTDSPHATLFRDIQGCASIFLGAQRAALYADFRERLENLKKANPAGAPAEQLISEMEDAGIRPFLHQVSSRAVQQMLRWPDDKDFPPEMMETAIEALKEARRTARDSFEGALDTAGTDRSGLFAKDDQTVVVRTAGKVPYLPALMARGAFCPMHPSFETHRDKLFSEVHVYQSNGPFRLKGRGAKPPEDQRSARAFSLVHLVPFEGYKGPTPAQVPEMMCHTDQGWEIELRMFERGDLQWVPVTWREYPPAIIKDRKGEKVVDKPRERIAKMPAFGVQPSPDVLVLLFRCDRSPFRERDARRAFAQSLDRQTITAAFLPPATVIQRLVPPGIDGRREGVEGPATDPTVALQTYRSTPVLQDADVWVELSYSDLAGMDDVAYSLVRYWKKVFGLDVGRRLESVIEQNRSRRSGAFYAMLTVLRAAVSDPLAYLEMFHSDYPDGGSGWKDEIFDTLVEAARDVDAVRERPDALLAIIQDTALKGAISAATTDGAKEALRLDLLRRAEQRLLDEFVVVPLGVLNRGALKGAFSGLGSEVAWRNPAFVGSLATVKK